MGEVSPCVAICPAGKYAPTPSVRGFTGVLVFAAALFVLFAAAARTWGVSGDFGGTQGFVAGWRGVLQVLFLEFVVGERRFAFTVLEGAPKFGPQSHGRDHFLGHFKDFGLIFYVFDAEFFEDEFFGGVGIVFGEFVVLCGVVDLGGLVEAVAEFDAVEGIEVSQEFFAADEIEELFPGVRGAPIIGGAVGFEFEF